MKNIFLFFIIAALSTFSCSSTTSLFSNTNRTSLSTYNCPNNVTQLSSLLSFYDYKNFKSIGIFQDFILSDNNKIIRLRDLENNVIVEALWLAQGYIDIYSLIKGDKLSICGYTSVISSPTLCFHTKSELKCSGNPPTCNQQIEGDMEKCNIGELIILILYAEKSSS